MGTYTKVPIFLENSLGNTAYRSVTVRICVRRACLLPHGATQATGKPLQEAAMLPRW